MPRALLLPLALCLAAPAALAQSRGEVRDTRDATVRAAGASRVNVVAEAGSLRIVGRDDLDEVRVRGTARASERDLLRLIDVRAERNGDVVDVRVVMPENLRDREWAALDLEIEVPRRVLLDVTDGSGDVEIRSVGELRLQDGSGDVELTDIGGPLRITDGSGTLRVRGVRGDVVLEDGSGDTELADVRGSVHVRADGSGELAVRDVTGSVRVDAKGSGSLVAERVRGDFVVEEKSSGEIRYRDIGGRVDVPRRFGRSGW